MDYLSLLHLLILGIPLAVCYTSIERLVEAYKTRREFPTPWFFYVVNAVIAVGSFGLAYLFMVYRM
ncbi:MAG: hypothetical protein HUK09_03450 [Bacteroidaceae bacterium]|nr:hypothetical protein [Bacteroidaceae bacterium]